MCESAGWRKKQPSLDIKQQDDVFIFITRVHRLIFRDLFVFMEIINLISFNGINFLNTAQNRTEAF